MSYSPEQISTFISALQHGQDPIGLIVHSDQSDTLVFSDLPKMSPIDLTGDIDPSNVFEHIFDCAQSSTWCRINVLDSNIAGNTYNLLRVIATTGHVQDTSVDTNILWPQTAKILVVISQEILEHISIPTFLNLFGPVLRG